MSNLCRLCMSSESLIDLLTLDGDLNLGIKAVSCIGIQIYPNDGLPTLICNSCKEMVTIFFSFKQKCLEIDLTLRALVNREFPSTRKNDVDGSVFHERLDQKPCRSQIVNTATVERTKSKTNIDNVEKFEYNKINCIEENKLKKKFQCEICGRIFKIKAGLDNHILTHSGLKPFQCKLCPKRYCRFESVTIHMRSHAGIKPYVCEICGKTSTKQQDLIRHMKIHSDERNYSCPRCDRRFKRASDVTSHMRTHTGIKPYHCQTCKKTYASHSGLRKHRQSHCKAETIVSIS